ncbi:MAG TPA: 3-methyl-2-oxobutanoate hydroxymethyltransferase, partial [Candidatus Desulfofervidus auxilii]|nr:3-methyl-2-oxobutanoate hydroxymethyltransferase [Candidatus Desulfofervidus auxilii]
SAIRLIEDALALEEAGAFGVVLECIPYQLAKLITEKLSIITIGIGAGPYCDGQVLVIHDLLGLFEKFTPKFVKVYANLALQIKEAIMNYKQEVEKGIFPDIEHAYSFSQEVWQALLKEVEKKDV